MKAADISVLCSSTLVSHIKDAVNDALTGETVRKEPQTTMADVLTQSSVIDTLIAALTDHERYKHNLNACIAPAAENIASEYVAKVQSATFSAPIELVDP